MRKRRHYKCQQNTVIWHIVELAIGYQNHDAKMITSRLKLEQIPGQISYYMDLTYTWKTSNVLSDSFTDDQYADKDTKDLLIFTDGSVNKEYKGGYGYHMMLSDQYRDCVRMKRYWEQAHLSEEDLRTHYKDLWQNTSKWNYERSLWLSDRCSIDFCEAYAIRDGLIRITKELRQHQGTIPFDQIRVVSDSQTVLRWLEGKYRIKNPTMKGILDDIIWQMACLYEEFGTVVMLQWVHSHVGTMGNEYVDHLAKQGMVQVLQDPKWQYNRWSWFSLKAAKNTVYGYQKQQMEQQLKLSLQKSMFSGNWWDHVQENGKSSIQWAKFRKEDMRQYTRNELRILIGIKSGHLKLRSYVHQRFQKLSSPNCRHCQQEETVLHLLQDCCEPSWIPWKEQIYRTAENLYLEYQDGFDQGMVTARQILYPQELPRQAQRMLYKELVHLVWKRVKETIDDIR